MANPRAKKELLSQIVRIKNLDDLDEFLVDLLTPSEYADIIVRWQIVKELYKGMPQRDISKKLGVSISKITRGSRELLNTSGGFHQALKKYL